MTASEITFSQVISDKELNDFIKNEGLFVRLIDKKNLPQTVTDNEKEIYKVLKNKKIRIEDALVLIDHIRTDSTSLQIPIFDRNGFRKDLEYNKQQNNKPPYIRTVGNPSGKDGVVVIDTNNKKATKYLYYQ